MSSSKQINFFITPSDWMAINMFFRTSNIQLIVNPVIDKNELFIESVSIEGNSNQFFLANSAFNSKIAFNKLKIGYSVEISESYCIQFSRGGFYPKQNDKLHRARFYAVTQFYNQNGDLIKKDEEFINWVNNIYKFFKKQFLKKTSLSTFYLSENALEWIEQNNARIDKAELIFSVEQG